MHHKRKRARTARAGCKLCKPWKVNGFRTERRDGEKFSDHARRARAEADLRALDRTSSRRNIPPQAPRAIRDAESADFWRPQP